MSKKFNLWSFILSLICLLLFYLTSFSGKIGNSILGIHPLKIVLCITLITLVIGAIGFPGAHDWKSMLRSVTTLIITFGLSAFLTFIIFFGSLLS